MERGYKDIRATYLSTSYPLANIRTPLAHHILFYIYLQKTKKEK